MKVRCCSLLMMSRKKNRAQFNFPLFLRERGITVPFVSGGFETRPYGTGTRGFWHRGIGGILASSCPITSAASSYWWYFGIIVLARGSRHYRVVGAGFKPARKGMRHTGIPALSYWHGDFLHYHIVGRVYNPPLQGFVGLLCPITSAASSYWWYFGIIILARGFFAFSYLVGGFETRPYRGSLGLLCPITSTASS